MTGHDLDQCSVSPMAERLAKEAYPYLCQWDAQPADEATQIEDVERLVEMGYEPPLSEAFAQWFAWDAQ